MLPFHQMILLDRLSQAPIYLQVVQQIIHLIQHGNLPARMRLPGSRKLSEQLHIHRNTVVKAYEELQALGWIEIQPTRGTFIASTLPLVQPSPWNPAGDSHTSSPLSFPFYPFPHIETPQADGLPLAFNDGLPDIRLAPVDELARTYASTLRLLAKHRKLGYTDAMGHPKLREILAKTLNETRAMNVSPDHLLITRGTIMAMHLAVASLIKPGDYFAVGESNYQTTNMLVRHFGGNLVRVPVDEAGIVTEVLEGICREKSIRGIYVTPHHHHPTTVTLSPERRIHLIELARIYNFVILEDDYDYDFHYDNHPILPLASGNHQGRVLYVGSFTKALAPAFRIGYLVASPSLIREYAKLRRVLDRQGDEVLEKSFAELLESGIIRRSLRKAWKHYKERRDYCCQLFEDRLYSYLQFQKPTGGMAIWTQFDPSIDLTQLQQRALARGLGLSDGARYQAFGRKENTTRMGFASMNIEELEQAVDILDRLLRN